MVTMENNIFQLDEMENLVAVTQTMLGIDRDEMLFNLIRLHGKKKSCLVISCIDLYICFVIIQTPLNSNPSSGPTPNVTPPQTILIQS